MPDSSLRFHKVLALESINFEGDYHKASTKAIFLNAGGKIAPFVPFNSTIQFLLFTGNGKRILVRNGSLANSGF